MYQKLICKDMQIQSIVSWYKLINCFIDKIDSPKHNKDGKSVRIAFVFIPMI
jgi:hypothetical protein